MYSSKNRFIGTVQRVFVRRKSKTRLDHVMGDNCSCGEVEFVGDLVVLKFKMVSVRIDAVSEDGLVLLGKQEGEPTLIC